MAVARLSKTTYPNIDTFDIDQYPNIGYGSINDIRAHCIVGGAITRPTADITAVATSITVEDISRYPSTPFIIQIEKERMNVTNVTSSTMTVTRGYDNTKAVAHLKRETIFEVLTEYVYLVANHAVKAINDVYIDDQKQSATRITKYTGQSGDAHADWPGVATIAFSADAYIAPQYNVDDANAKESGASVDATIDIATSPYLHDGLSSTYQQITGGEVATVSFDADGGYIRSQTYTVDVTNPDETYQATCIVSATESAVAGALKTFTIPANTSKTLTISRKTGNFNDALNVACGTGVLRVTNMAKTVIIRTEEYTVDSNFASQTIAHSKEHWNDYAKVMWTQYDTTALGNAILGETHTCTITTTGTTSVRLCSVDESTGDACAIKDFNKLPAGSHTLTLEVDATGAWDSVTKLVVINGNSVQIDAMDKVMKFTTNLTDDYDSFYATSSARIVVGDRISVDADWAVDTTGDYGGATNLIERPDWVMKHFLIVHLGFTSGEIDGTSFTAAGTSYGTDSYTFGFIWRGEKVEDMAFEARSTINYSADKWYLNRIPDTAPAASKTIAKAELAGEQSLFTFDVMPTHEIQNDLSASYLYNYKDNQFDEVVTDSDATSKTKHGTYYGDYEFRFIRDATMAAHVLAHILLQRKDPLKTIRFPLFWEHFDLSVGDTVDITNDIYNAEKYYIENINRDNKIAQITGKEWW